MAAKGYSSVLAKGGRPSGVRRRPRIRSRATVPKPIKLPPTESTEITRIRSAPFPTPPSASDDRPISPESLFLNSPTRPDKIRSPPINAAAILDGYVDGDRELVPRTSGETLLLADLKAASQPDLPSPTLSFTDFSNFTGTAAVSPGTNRRASVVPVSIYDPEIYSPPCPGQDVYGWDAELERKMHERCQPGGAWDGRRSAMNLKRGLIQRVFHFGISPRETV